MITIEVCPLRDENVLASIIDGTNQQMKIEQRVAAFRNIITCPGMRVAFDQMEDHLAVAAAVIQRETVKQIHCPSCQNFADCSTHE